MTAADPPSSRRLDTSTPSGPRCAACDGATSEPIYGGLLRCLRCGHAFAPPDASDEDLAAIYTESYFAGEEYHDYLGDKGLAQRNFRSRLRVLKSFIDPARHRRLFEVGCAYGFFLELARQSFDSVQGIDVSAAAASYAKNVLHLDAACGDFLHYDLAGREFDVACMWDTIEHLPHPDLYVSKLAHHMRTGALFAVTTGDFASLNARLRGAKWRLMHPPSHAHYFSIASMTSMLDRFGFDVVYARHCGFYRSLRSMAYGVFVQKHNDARALELLNRIGLGGFPLYLNFYDIMYVIARKR
jgi:SAM-dependent methyltransferase